MTLNMSTRSSTLTLDYDSRTSANKSKFIKDRVTFVEKSFGNLCDTFGAIARKNGKLRDKHDELCQHLLGYAETNTYNTTSRASLSQLTRELACCDDYQDLMVKRLEGQVVGPLMVFDTVITNSREEIKNAFSAYEKEQKSKKAVDSMREKHPSDTTKLNIAETELQKAKVHASRSTKALEEAIDSFEQKKLRDLKTVIGNYIKIQMSYHAKSLEALTRAYKNLDVYDDEEDLEEFRQVLHPTSATERQNMMRSVGGGSRQSIASQNSLRSAGSRSSPVRTTAGAVVQQPAAPSKLDMFTTSQVTKTYTETTTTATKASPSRGQPQRSNMMGGDEESDEDSDDSGSELEEVQNYNR